MEKHHIIASVRNSAALEATSKQLTGLCNSYLGNAPNIRGMIG
jgi:hypothetical protein